MHGYIFVDYNCDREFDQTLNATGTTGGEVVAYNYYEGRNSKGVTTSSGGAFTTVPSFTLPYNIAKGDYRLRVKIDWNSINACGNPGQSIAANGGSQVDFTLRIVYPTGVEEADVADAKVYSAEGSLYIYGYSGNVKVVNTMGQLVKDIDVVDNEQIELNRGVYLVVLNGRTEKIVVE